MIAHDFMGFIKKLDQEVAVGITADPFLSLRFQHAADEFGKATPAIAHDGPSRVLPGCAVSL